MTEKTFVEVEEKTLNQYKAGFEAYNVLVKSRLTEESERIEERQIRDLADAVLKESVFIKDVFNGVLFIEHVLNSYPGKTFITPMNDQGGDVIYRYNPEIGIFSNNGVPFIEQSLLKILGTDTQTVMYNAIKKHMQVKTYTEPDQFQENPYITVMKNGSFNILTNEFGEHSPEYMAKCRIPVNYDKEADCPTFKEFLKRILPKEEHRVFWQEWMGYHLLKDYRFQRTVILQGEGDNGKSTLLSVLATLVGNDNVSTENLFRLTTNRFSPAELFGKIANISADIGPKELKFTGMIKTLTGNDLVPAERKNRDPFSFKNYAKLTFSCNQLPKSPDRTLAFYKRFIVLVTGPPIPQDEQDASLIEGLTSEEELSGIFNWALEGLTRALDRGKLAEPSDIMTRKMLYQNMSEPEIGFTSEYIVENNAGFISRDMALRQFTKYCDENGFVPSSDKVLYDTIRKNFYCKETKPNINGVRTRGFSGIAWTFLTPEPNGTHGTDGTGVSTLLEFDPKISESQNGVPSVPPVPKPEKHPSFEEQTKDSELIRLARYYVKNQGGKCKTEDLVMHLSNNGYDFNSFKNLKRYTLIFKVSKGHIEALEGPWDD